MKREPPPKIPTSTNVMGLFLNSLNKFLVKYGNNYLILYDCNFDL